MLVSRVGSLPFLPQARPPAAEEGRVLEGPGKDRAVAEPKYSTQLLRGWACQSNMAWLVSPGVDMPCSPPRWPFIAAGAMFAVKALAWPWFMTMGATRPRQATQRPTPVLSLGTCFAAGAFRILYAKFV